MGESKIHEVINETCEALWIVLQPQVMRPQGGETGSELKKASDTDGIFQIVWVHWMVNTSPSQIDQNQAVFFSIIKDFIP